MTKESKIPKKIRRESGVSYTDQWRIPDALWKKIEPLLPPGKPHPLGCHNPPVEPRKAMDAIFFVVRTGCQWNALNATGICSSSSAHRWFQTWTKAGVFVKLWQMGLLEYDRRKGIGWRWQALDGALTKAPLGGKRSGPNPTDRAKRGVKRSLLTEAKGLPIGLTIAGANRHDSQLVRATLESVPIRRPKPTRKKPQHLLLDKAYIGDPVQEVVREFGYTAHVPLRGAQAQKIKRQTRHKARRWVVERTHSWMNRFRGILIRWEKKPENYFALLHLVCAFITYRVAGLLR